MEQVVGRRDLPEAPEHLVARLDLDLVLSRAQVEAGRSLLSDGPRLAVDPGRIPGVERGLVPDVAKAKIDELVSQILADPKGAYFEIEGHTDNVGDEIINAKIGLDRAETVKRYLYEQHQVPLHKMNAISFGEEKPVTDNKNRANRSQNRRVVIKVLA